jgi:MFS family permease
MSKIINKVIKTLIISDFFTNLGWGFLSPVFAIFILENVSHGGLTQAAQVAGLSASFYWIPKSFFQIPIGIYLDKNHGEKDDFWFMIIGTFLMSLVPIGYLFSSAPWHIYCLQIVYAAGAAMSFPSWMAIFTRHIDKNKEAFEWGMESTFLGLGAGIAGGLSGGIVAIFGFKFLLIGVSIFTLLSTFLLLLIKDNIFSRDGRPTIFSIEKPSVEP